jgi:hypothetical protein
LDFFHEGNVSGRVGRWRCGEELGDGLSYWFDVGRYANSTRVYIEEEIPPFRVVFEEGVRDSCDVTRSKILDIIYGRGILFDEFVYF